MERLFALVIRIEETSNHGPISGEHNYLGFVLSLFDCFSDSIGPKTMEQLLSCNSRLYLKAYLNYFKISNLYISKALDTEKVQASLCFHLEYLLIS